MDSILKLHILESLFKTKLEFPVEACGSTKETVYNFPSVYHLISALYRCTSKSEEQQLEVIQSVLRKMASPLREEVSRVSETSVRGQTVSCSRDVSSRHSQTQTPRSVRSIRSEKPAVRRPPKVTADKTCRRCVSAKTVRAPKDRVRNLSSFQLMYK